MNYTVEQVLDHNIKWVNKMLEIVSREQFDRTIMELQMHGVEQKSIDKMKSNYNRQFGSLEKLKENTTESLNRLRSMPGIHIGRKNTTKVINR